jgi:hypothetical protein
MLSKDAFRQLVLSVRGLGHLRGLEVTRQQTHTGVRSSCLDAEGLPSQPSARRPLEFVEYEVSYLTMVSGLMPAHKCPVAVPRRPVKNGRNVSIAQDHATDLDGDRESASLFCWVCFS